MVRLLVAPVIVLLMLLPATGECQEISGPDVRLLNNDMYVSFSLDLDGKQLQELKEGIDKELKLYVDLFRVWRGWPDEFVLGKLFNRKLRVDPIKREYVASTNDGAVIIEKRFRSPESLLAWALSVKDLKLTSIRELEPGRYFVRVTAEAKVRKIPVIGYFFFFLKETDFRISKDSAVLNIEAGR
ncbi:MAG: DUF4390 domain-containing protein [Nitrospiraceae bacterium]|nr:DUF4390 domain-containing protein [Nitrospiraceae bacterium]